MWARIEDGFVMEVTDIDPNERFHPSLIWVKCEEPVTHGMIYLEGEFMQPNEQEI